MYQSHRHDSTHPSLFYQVGYHSYICGVQHCCAKSCITLWSNARRMVTHPCINWAHDCLTSVIKHKMFAPCYVSLYSPGGPSAKVYLPTKFCVLIVKAYMLFSGGSIWQSIFVCQHLSTSIQGIYGLVWGGVNLPKHTCLPSFVYW